MKKNHKDYLIIALDTSDKSILKTVDELGDSISFYKVGLELFSACGVEIVHELKQRGKKIFFDGKFFDIPNTVKSAIKNIVRLNVDILNIHILGGKSMMQESKQIVLEESKKLNITPPKLIGVTILTSMNENNLKTELKINEDLNSYVLYLASLAYSSDLDGVVASPHEVKSIRDKIGPDFCIVTPGVRPSWAESNDQKRITTPKEAVQNGADHIVVGRPILNAKNKKEAAEKILIEIEEGII